MELILWLGIFATGNFDRIECIARSVCYKNTKFLLQGRKVVIFTKENCAVAAHTQGKCNLRKIPLQQMM